MRPRPHKLKNLSDFILLLRWSTDWVVFFGKKLYRSLITIAQILFFSPLWIPLLIWLQKNKKFLIIADLERHGQNISNFVTFIEPELRRRISTEGNLSRLIVLNLSKDANS
ncbi:MAG: hypothetical protein ACKOH9_01335, partial [Actinomycetota bacterium]